MRIETFPEFLARDPAPDLQALAKEWGGFGNIPDAVLDRFQQARDSWNLRRMFRPIW